MRHDPDKAVNVALIWREHHAPPRLVDPDRPYPVVPAPGELLQVQPGMYVLCELVDRGLDAALTGLGSFE
jgi:hypothetical protein